MSSKSPKNPKREMDDSSSSDSELPPNTNIGTINISYRPSTHIISHLPSLIDANNNYIKPENTPLPNPILPNMAIIAAIPANDDSKITDETDEAKVDRNAGKAGQPLHPFRRFFDPIYKNKELAKTKKGKKLANIRFYMHRGCGQQVGTPLAKLYSHGYNCTRMHPMGKAEATLVYRNRKNVWKNGKAITASNAIIAGGATAPDRTNMDINTQTNPRKKRHTYHSRSHNSDWSTQHSHSHNTKNDHSTHNHNHYYTSAVPSVPLCCSQLPSLPLPPIQMQSLQGLAPIVQLPSTLDLNSIHSDIECESMVQSLQSQKSMEMDIYHAVTDHIISTLVPFNNFESATFVHFLELCIAYAIRYKESPPLPNRKVLAGNALKNKTRYFRDIIEYRAVRHGRVQIFMDQTTKRKASRNIIMIGIDGAAFAYAVHHLGNGDKTAAALAEKSISMFKPLTDRGVIILLDMSDSCSVMVKERSLAHEYYTTNYPWFNHNAVGCFAHVNQNGHQGLMKVDHGPWSMAQAALKKYQNKLYGTGLLNIAKSHFGVAPNKQFGNPTCANRLQFVSSLLLAQWAHENRDRHLNILADPGAAKFINDPALIAYMQTRQFWHVIAEIIFFSVPFACAIGTMNRKELYLSDAMQCHLDHLKLFDYSVFELVLALNDAYLTRNSATIIEAALKLETVLLSGEYRGPIIVDHWMSAQLKEESKDGLETVFEDFDLDIFQTWMTVEEEDLGYDSEVYFIIDSINLDCVTVVCNSSHFAFPTATLMTILRAGHGGYLRNFKRAYAPILSAAYMIDTRYKRKSLPHSFHEDGLGYWAAVMNSETSMGAFVTCMDQMQNGEGPFVGDLWSEDVSDPTLGPTALLRCPSTDVMYYCRNILHILRLSPCNLQIEQFVHSYRQIDAHMRNHFDHATMDMLAMARWNKKALLRVGEPL